MRIATTALTLLLAAATFALVPPASASHCADLAHDVDLCTGEEGCWGVVGDDGTDLRNVGVADCRNAEGCFVWLNGQRLHGPCE